MPNLAQFRTRADRNRWYVAYQARRKARQRAAFVLPSYAAMCGCI